MLRILIAEDDFMIGDIAEAFLVDAGYDVCGIARTASQAAALAKACEPDLLLLDLRLADGGLGTEIVAQVDPRAGLGILYASGNTSDLVLTQADGHAALAKPYRANDLLRALELVRAFAATGTTAPPYPHGFRILPPGCPRGECNFTMSDEAEHVRKLLRQQAALRSPAKPARLSSTWM